MTSLFFSLRFLSGFVSHGRFHKIHFNFFWVRYFVRQMLFFDVICISQLGYRKKKMWKIRKII